ncbi:hypothetical protein ACFVAF_20910 [Streptomyces sp. NPDC057596]|uniref:hypothetical protein n=1 Tax=Streptomyces sp. NPDC057596 TaxID=3346178 RepID=UPI0036CF7364
MTESVSGHPWPPAGGGAAQHSCRVKEIIDVDLPGWRDQIATVPEPCFAELRATVFSMIKESA